MPLHIHACLVILEIHIVINYVIIFCFVICRFDKLPVRILIRRSDKSSKLNLFNGNWCTFKGGNSVKLSVLKGIYLERKEYDSWGSKLFLFKIDIFSADACCPGKQTENHETRESGQEITKPKNADRKSQNQESRQ